MGNYTNYRFIKASIFFILTILCFSDEILKVKEGYVLYSLDDKYVYASGDLHIEVLGRSIIGKRFYFDLRKWEGVLAGDVKFNNKKYDILVLEIKDKKLQWMGMSFGEEIKREGRRLKIPVFKYPDELRKAAIYFEAKEITVNELGRVKGVNVIPYALGAPSLPMKYMVLDLGKPPDKTHLRPGTLRYTQEEGAFAGVVLDVREKIYRGAYELKYFERGLFKIPGDPRGIIFSGSGSFGRKGKPSILDNSVFYTTMGKYMDFILSSTREGKLFEFRIQNRVTTREGEKPHYWFSSSLRFKKLKFFQPVVEVGWNYYSSYVLGVSTEIIPVKNSMLSLSWVKNTQEDHEIITKTEVSSLRFSYTPSIFNLNLNASLTDDLIERTLRKDMSMNLQFKPVFFLEKSFSLTLESFFTFSRFPYGDSYSEKVNPGLRISLSSEGFLLPAGFEFLPGVDINQMWEKGKTSWTEFNYFLGLKKPLWKFTLGVDFSLNARYKSGGFWVEGYNNYYLNGRIEFKNQGSFITTVFYFNDKMELERISSMGDIGLFLGFRVRFFSIYNNLRGRLTTLETYLEKNLRNAIKLQLGYSLNLKKYFFRVIPL